MNQRNRLGWWLDTHPIHLMGWGYVLIVVLVMALCFGISSQVHAAPLIASFTATPASDVAPADVTLTWSSTGTAACTASGGWSGAKTASGTEVIKAVKSGTTSFSLTCAEGAGANVLTWTAPALNTDGTPLTNLAGYKVFWGMSPSSLLDVIPVQAPTTSYTHSGLAAGTYHYALASVTSQGVESARTPTISAPVTLSSTAPSSASVTLKNQSNPPTNFKVTTGTLAFELRYYPSNGTFRMVQVGTVPLGVACGADLAGGFALFDGAKITKPTTGGAITAKCS